MGTNYYLRRKRPTIHETVHIGKLSWGWRFCWDSCDMSDWPRWCDRDPDRMHMLPRSIRSVDDIREYLRSGEWDLVSDEDGVIEDWERELEGMCAWDGGMPGAEPRVPHGYEDGEGQVFDHGGGFN